jgi:hypothetical protein
MQDIYDELTSDPPLDEPNEDSFAVPKGLLYQSMGISEYISSQSQKQADLINAVSPFWNLSQSLVSVAEPFRNLNQSLAIGGAIENFSKSLTLMTELPFRNLNQSLASIAGTFGNFGQSFVFMNDSLQNLSSSLNFAHTLGVYSSSLNTYVNSIPSLMPPVLKRFGEWLRKWILAAFEHAGLCLAPSMSVDVMYRVADWSWKGDLRPVTLLVWNYYSRNNHARLRDAAYGWRDNPEFCARWRYYEEAFKAHVQGLYSSSIRGLMPEIEGIASRFVYVNAIKMKPNRPGLDLKKTASVVDRMLNVAADVANLDTQATEMEHWIRVKSLKQFLENVFYENLDFEQNFDEVRNRRKLSRHGSLHGIQIGSVMAMNSLRLFLLLDTIHYILQVFTANGGVI